MRSTVGSAIVLAQQGGGGPQVSQTKWPWHRWVVLGLLILVVGIVGGWLLASCTTPDTSASSSMSAIPSTQIITVTIPDKDKQLSPDQNRCQRPRRDP